MAFLSSCLRKPLASLASPVFTSYPSSLPRTLHATSLVACLGEQIVFGACMAQPHPVPLFRSNRAMANIYSPPLPSPKRVPRGHPAGNMFKYCPAALVPPRFPRPLYPLETPIPPWVPSCPRKLSDRPPASSFTASFVWPVASSWSGWCGLTTSGRAILPCLDSSCPSVP